MRISNCLPLKNYEAKNNQYFTTNRYLYNIQG
jgi:hypothetical protein